MRPRPRLGVLTWNVWGRFGDWRARQPAVTAAIAACEPDVMLLQESWRGPGGVQAEIVAEALGFHAAYASSRMPQEPEPGWELGLAVLSRWPLADLRQHPLPAPAEEAGLVDPSVVLHAELAHPDGPMHVMTTCLDWEENRARQRKSQATALAELAGRSELDGTLPVVVAGDLNCRPESPAFEALLEALTDCWAAANGDDPGHTYADDNPNMVPGEWLVNARIDHVLARPGQRSAALDVQGAQLVGLPLGGRAQSDHYGVLVALG